MKTKIVAFVDHEIGFRLLQKMLAKQDDYLIEVVAAVTTADNGKKWWPGVEAICRTAGLPLSIYEDEQQILKSSIVTADWYLLLSWKYIVPKEIMDQPKLGLVNLHYSLLPEYRGVYPVNWAIMEGREKTGITYHLVNEKIDAGEILIQAEEPILLNDTARSLQCRLDDLAYNQFDNLIPILRNYRPGSSTTPEGCPSSYKARDDFRVACEIDLNRNYKGIDFFNLLRGLTFLDVTKNAYILDKKTGKRIYLSLSIGD